MMHEPIYFPNLGIEVRELPDAFEGTFFGITLAFRFRAFFMAAAILIVVLSVLWIARKRKEEGINYLSLLIWSVPVGLLSGRVVHILLHLGAYLEKPLQMLVLSDGGYAFSGVLCGSVLCVLLRARAMKENAWKFLDAAAPGTALGLAIYSLADFFERTGIGRYTRRLFAIRYSIEEIPTELITEQMKLAAQKGKYIGFVQGHPLFLYRFAMAFLLALFLFILERRSARHDRCSHGFRWFLAGWSAIELASLWVAAAPLCIPGTVIPIAAIFYGILCCIAVISIIGHLIYHLVTTGR